MRVHITKDDDIEFIQKLLDRCWNASKSARSGSRFLLEVATSFSEPTTKRHIFFGTKEAVF
jgi:hypothetical protein